MDRKLFLQKPKHLQEPSMIFFSSYIIVLFIYIS